MIGPSVMLQQALREESKKIHARKIKEKTFAAKQEKNAEGVHSRFVTGNL